MEEPKIKYCFIGKTKTFACLLEHNRLKRNTTILEAKQMFVTCCKFNTLNANERSVIKSKDGCFYLKMYSPDLLIQLFGDNSLMEDEAFYAIDRIKEMIDNNDGVSDGNIQVKNKTDIISFLENYIGLNYNNDDDDGNVDGNVVNNYNNKEEDIVISVEDECNKNKTVHMNMNTSSGNDLVMVNNRTSTPLVYNNINSKFQMNLRQNIINNNNIETYYANQRYPDSIQSEIRAQPLQNINSQSSQTLIQHQLKSQLTPVKELDSYNDNVIKIQEIGTLKESKTTNIINGDNKSTHQASTFLKTKSYSKPLSNKGNSNTMQLLDLQGKPIARTSNNNLLIYSPYSYQSQQTQGIQEESLLSKWIIFSVLIVIIFAVAIAIPLIMAFSNSF